MASVHTNSDLERFTLEEEKKSGGRSRLKTNQDIDIVKSEYIWNTLQPTVVYYSICKYSKNIRAI